MGAVITEIEALCQDVSLSVIIGGSRPCLTLVMLCRCVLTFSLGDTSVPKLSEDSHRI